MKKTKSVRVVHTAKHYYGDGGQTASSSFYYCIQIQIVLISEIEDVSRYVVPYTGKRYITSQAEIDAFQNINMKWVKTWHDIWFLTNMYPFGSYQWTYSLIFEWYVSLDSLHILLYINQTEHTVFLNWHQKYNQLTLDQFFY
jgi:hypothetical protein